MIQRARVDSHSYRRALVIPLGSLRAGREEGGLAQRNPPREAEKWRITLR
jgi:hypothetical protein